MWWAGFGVMLLGVTIHVLALPYADMTLLAANSALAVTGNLFLSIYLFDEKWVFKYDAPAIFFIIGGSFAIVMLSNKE